MGTRRTAPILAWMQDAPATTLLVALLAAGFFVSFTDAAGKAAGGIALQSETAGARPWTLLTYPFYGGIGVQALFSLLFGGLCTWQIGRWLERDEGSLRLLAIWTSFSTLCALGYWTGAGILGQKGMLFQPWPPIAAITIVWAARNSQTTVLLMGAMPIAAKWIAVLAAVIVFFGTRPTSLAPFATLPLAIAWLYAVRMLPGFGGPAIGKRRETFVRGAGFYSKEYFDDVKRRKKEREEQRRLKELFERSMKEPPDEDP